MVDFKKLSEKEEKKEELKPLTVPFVGGKAVISPGGSFVADEGKTTEKVITYDPKVKLGTLCDQKGNCDPQTFLSMVRAISSNPVAITLLEKLIQ